MNKLEVLSGIVSNVKNISTTTGDIKKGKGSIDTDHKVTFRINNKPAKFSGSPNLGDNDHVTAVGEGEGELIVYALRNDTTGVCYPADTVTPRVIAIGAILAGTPGLYFVSSLGGWIWMVLCGLVFWAARASRKRSIIINTKLNEAKSVSP